MKAQPPLRVVMLTYSYYEYDNRVRRYAETLARRGDHVRIFCLGREEAVRAGQWETVDGVEVRRLQSRSTPESGPWSHVWRQGCFLVRALVQLSPRNLPEGCDLLHVHNIPDYLVFAGWRLKRQGAPIILDIHDIVPELYESKFRTPHRSLMAAALRRLERWSCRFADHVIISNHIWEKTLVGRSAPPSKVTALVNHVDLDSFSPRPRTRADGRILLLYPGSLNHHQGLDFAIGAMPSLVHDFPAIELHIYGDGPALPELKEQARRLDVADKVRFLDSVPVEQVPDLMANADLGIVPKRAEGFGGQAYSTKVLEFMSQGLPVVLARTPIDRLYFDDSVVAFFEPGNPDHLAQVVRKVLRDTDYRQQLSRRGLAHARANSWESMQGVYLELVDRLAATAAARRAPERRHV